MYSWLEGIQIFGVAGKERSSGGEWAANIVENHGTT